MIVLTVIWQNWTQTQLINAYIIIEIIIMFIPLHSVYEYVLVAYVIWLSWDNGNLLAFWRNEKKKISPHTSMRAMYWRENKTTLHNIYTNFPRHVRRLMTKIAVTVVSFNEWILISTQNELLRVISFCSSRTSHTRSKWIEFRMNDKCA